MGWRVTGSEVSAGVAEVERQLSQAVRWARGGLESVDADSRAEVEGNIEELRAVADRLDRVGSYASEIRWLADEAEQRFEEMDDEAECSECGERLLDASVEDRETSEVRCAVCSKADLEPDEV